MGKFIDLTGRRFGKLTVLGIGGRDKNGQIKWLCMCDCGNQKIISGGSLTRTNRPTHSCGCETSLRTHGQRNTRLYRIWSGMKSRCCNTNNSHYKNYGGRGVRICEEWLHNFVNFYDWALKNGYSDDLSIDRINNNGNYEPSNCRWVDPVVQGNNRRTNQILEFDGERKTVKEWSDEIGMPDQTIYKRLEAGWSVEEILTTPVNI